MKWTIRKGKFPQGTRDEEKVLFEEIELKRNDGEDEVKVELEKLGYVVWIAYPIPKKTTYTEEELQAIAFYTKPVVESSLPIKNQVARRKYEVFCGGFLFFNDVIFKKYPQGKGDPTKDYPDGKEYPDRNFEHKIYFEWFKGKGVNDDQVRIYINETPPPYNANPTPPPPPPPPES